MIVPEKDFISIPINGDVLIKDNINLCTRKKWNTSLAIKQMILTNRLPHLSDPENYQGWKGFFQQMIFISLKNSLHKDTISFQNPENGFPKKESHFLSIGGVFPEKEDHLLNLGGVFPEKEDHLLSLKGVFPEKEDHLLNLGGVFPEKENYLLNLGGVFLEKENDFLKIKT